VSDHPLGAAIAGVFLCAIGLAIGGGVLVVNRQEQQALEGWRRADGTVIELLKRRTVDGEAITPLIAFTTSAGERVSFTAGAMGNPSEYVVTDKVSVIYPPGQPQDARIDTRARRWSRNALAGGAALILICLGGYVAWYASRWDKIAPRTSSSADTGGAND
jgi:hypothetical protein